MEVCKMYGRLIIIPVLLLTTEGYEHYGKDNRGQSDLPIGHVE